ncbi:hypothetical protein JW890_00065 [candidate division WOR-3 bacterium]|nr:hypothetical protein [candidate division WOR-3 bacterium]
MAKKSAKINNASVKKTGKLKTPKKLFLKEKPKKEIIKPDPVLNVKKIPPKKDSGITFFRDSIVYASGDLSLSSAKNNEFFIAARANVKITGKKTSLDIKGVIKITLPQGDSLAENIFFSWLDSEVDRDHIFEDREKKWLGKWIKYIETFNNLDEKNIKKIPIDWDFLSKNYKLNSETVKLFKVVYSAGWSKSYENPYPLSSVKSKTVKIKPGLIKAGFSKNPLPIVIPFFRFLDGEGKRIYDNECIKDLIVAEN